MNIAFLCVLIMGLLPYVWVGFAKFGAGFDNHSPRESLAKLTGYRKRANWAQMNQFEAMPLFIAGVAVATYNNAPQEVLTILAISVVILRIIHGILYMMDYATPRTIVWVASFACTIAMFFI